MHCGQRGEEDNRGQTRDGMRRGIRDQEEDLNGEIDRNQSWETVGWQEERRALHLLNTRTAEELAILQAPCTAESQLRSSSQKRARSSALASLCEHGSLKAADYFTCWWSSGGRLLL